MRSSSRGAAPNTSAAIHGVERGSSYQEMNDEMPAWATSPTALTAAPAACRGTRAGCLRAA